MIAWSDNYLMGIAEFDNEHKKLFQIAEQILNRLRVCGDEEGIRMFILREGLKYLNGYFLEHAAHEEAYMKKIGYEGYSLHKMQHDDFRECQLTRYHKLMESGACSKEDIWDFVGSGIGWLLEHITTADMAIVGKGEFSKPIKADVNAAALEEEINMLFSVTLNIEVRSKIVSSNYNGDSFGKAVCQRIVYETGGRKKTVISGIERSFMMKVAKMIYGDTALDEMDLVLSTVETFGAQFWLTFYRQLTGDDSQIIVRENQFLIGRTLKDEIRKMRPAASLLFTSDMGKFFVATNSECVIAKGVFNHTG